MNKLQDEFGEKGLSVLAVTSDPDRKKTAAWIKDLGAEFPYAYAKDGKLSEAAGVEGIPHAMLVGPDGEILWTGSPYNLPKKLVKDSLKGASKHLTFGWDKEFSDAAKALGKLEFAKAISIADASKSEGGKAVADEIRGMVTRSVADMEKTLEAGDYLGAQGAAETLVKNLKGLPEVANAEAVLANIKADPEAKDVMKGQKKLAKLMESDLKKKGAKAKAIKSAGKLAEKYDGTIVAKHANAWVKDLKSGDGH